PGLFFRQGADRVSAPTHRRAAGRDLSSACRKGADDQLTNAWRCRPVAVIRQTMCRAASKPERRRALELLVASPDGCTEAIMLAHGFPVPLLVDLCIAGLAIATPEQIVAGGRPARGRSHEDHRGGAKGDQTSSTGGSV